MELTQCSSCRTNDALVLYDPKYKGERGYCLHCGGNWPES